MLVQSVQSVQEAGVHACACVCVSFFLSFSVTVFVSKKSPSLKPSFASVYLSRIWKLRRKTRKGHCTVTKDE